MRLSCAIVLFALLTSCGVSYIAPTVDSEAAGAQVEIRPLTIASVSSANAVPYTPQTLPPSFFAQPGRSSSPDNAPLPDPPFEAADVKSLPYDPPPDVPVAPYQIGIGDVVLLATPRGDGSAAELAGLLAAQSTRQGYVVRDDGQITLPDIGTARIAGLDIEAAEMVIFDLLVANDIDPAFSLEVQAFHAHKIAVGGAVKDPQVLPVGLIPPTLSEALSAAGGLDIRDRGFAALRLYRDGRLYQFPVDRYLAEPALQARRLAPGDVIFADTTYDLDRAQDFFRQHLDRAAVDSERKRNAQAVLESEITLRRNALEDARRTFVLRQELNDDARDFVFLTGEVDQRGRKPLPYGRQASLMDILYGDGGFSPETGDPSQIYVLRKGGPGIIAWHLDARNAAAFIVAEDMQMRPGDVIFVEEQRITKFGRALSQALPSLVSTAGRVATQ